ncbi:hypothetical protein Acr_07g0000200 [Actinidia rufa]|uniref:Uncharacterized protein n=1 Tax=Actinidia rufa TaxID=165716 RepID=A0A7J0ETS5_9ERIC|nr:hypothetical protein Acr_07g0000200 [Actinidia rufa]
MASSPLTSKSCHHARSISLPSRSHPLVPQFDEHLCSLNTSEATTSSIEGSLSGLENMYDGLYDLLLLLFSRSTSPCTKTPREIEKSMEKMLDGYVRLLDVCATAKDVSSQAKQDVQNLLSALRIGRKTNDFAGYLASRKKAKKQQKAQSRPPVAFSLVSKMMNRKRVSSKDENTNASDFEKFDAALDWLNGPKPSKSDNAIHIENVQNQLGKMELSLGDLEEGLECLFRRFIKTRVSLLNILNH